MIILGVDPGTIITGYAVLDFSKPKAEILECDIISMDKHLPMPERLKIIYDRLTAVIKKFHPDEFVIETAFYNKNVQSTLKLGQARGVSILAAAKNKIPISEYSPREIKKSVVGHGNASKEQVRYMITHLLDFRQDSKILDYSDAVAVALCHNSNVLYGQEKKKGPRNWKEYIINNPGKVKVMQ